METKVTKSNYEDVLNKIAAEFNLEKFTSVSSNNGYPEEEYSLLEGLQSEEQANEILAKYPQAIFVEVEWLDGWRRKYRRNYLTTPRCYKAVDELDFDNNISGLWHKGDDVREFEVFYLGDGLQDEAERLIAALQDEMNTKINEPDKDYYDCGVAEYQDFIKQVEKILVEADYVSDYIKVLLHEMKERVQEVINMRQELEELEDGVALRIDNYNQTQLVDEKSMYWCDGDITHRCIAVGFMPYFLPDNDNEEKN